MIYESVARSTPRLVVEAPGEVPKIDLDSSGMHPECVYYGAAHFDYVNAPPGGTLDNVVRNAQAVLRGQIVDLTNGFYLGEPNTLLTVRVERRVRASKAFPESTTFYVVYPQGTLQYRESQFLQK